ENVLELLPPKLKAVIEEAAVAIEAAAEFRSKGPARGHRQCAEGISHCRRRRRELDEGHPMSQQDTYPTEWAPRQRRFKWPKKMSEASFHARQLRELYEKGQLSEAAYDDATLRAIVYYETEAQ
ncbi:MAG: hypothetical protein AB1705_27775, partial [Verrucomicrobiota bacterium]